MRGRAMPRLALLLTAAALLATLAACERTTRSGGGASSGPYIGVGGGVNRATQ
jgi:hypothetical protein